MKKFFVLALVVFCIGLGYTFFGRSKRFSPSIDPAENSRVRGNARLAPRDSQRERGEPEEFGELGETSGESLGESDEDQAFRQESGVGNTDFADAMSEQEEAEGRGGVPSLQSPHYSENRPSIHRGELGSEGQPTSGELNPNSNPANSGLSVPSKPSDENQPLPSSGVSSVSYPPLQNNPTSYGNDDGTAGGSQPRGQNMGYPGERGEMRGEGREGSLPPGGLMGDDDDDDDFPTEGFRPSRYDPANPNRQERNYEGNNYGNGPGSADLGPGNPGDQPRAYPGAAGYND